MELSSSSTRVAVTDPLQAEAMLAAVAMEVGREIRVFVRPAALISQESLRESHEEEPEAFYEFTSEDYARLMASKKEEGMLLLIQMLTGDYVSIKVSSNYHVSSLPCYISIQVNKK
ncbi:hypothetical protein O6H91_Y256000 [Diphasiastrum complanatum]|nr:hypothetical protein O6H91_Y256000 [Diphasiastrum complanatum]